nr:histidine kinase [uncultured Dyadobacter sp.]
MIQKQFTSSILQTQDLERQRIAADLHDDLGGTLATIERNISDLIAAATTP